MGSRSYREWKDEMEDKLGESVGRARERMNEVRRDFHDLQVAAFLADMSEEPEERGQEDEESSRVDTDDLPDWDEC